MDRPYPAISQHLATLYESESDARRILRDLGMDPGRIHFGEPAVNFWSEIVELAENTSRLGDLFKQARREYRDNTRLEELQQEYYDWLSARKVDSGRYTVGKRMADEWLPPRTERTIDDHETRIRTLETNQAVTSNRLDAHDTLHAQPRAAPIALSFSGIQWLTIIAFVILAVMLGLLLWRGA